MSAKLFINEIFHDIKIGNTINIGTEKIHIMLIKDTDVYIHRYEENDVDSILSVTSIHTEITSRRTEISYLKKQNKTLLASLEVEENDDKAKEIMETIRENTLLIRNHTVKTDEILSQNIKMETNRTTITYKLSLGVLYTNFMCCNINIMYIKSGLSIPKIAKIDVVNKKDIKFEHIDSKMIHNFMWNLVHTDMKKYADSISYWNNQSYNSDIYYMVPYDKKKDMKPIETDLYIHKTILRSVKEIKEDKNKLISSQLIKNILRSENGGILRDLYNTYIFSDHTGDILIPIDDITYGTNTQAKKFSLNLAEEIRSNIKIIKSRLYTQSPFYTIYR